MNKKKMIQKNTLVNRAVCVYSYAVRVLICISLTHSPIRIFVYNIYFLSNYLTVKLYLQTKRKPNRKRCDNLQSKNIRWSDETKYLYLYEWPVVANDMQSSVSIYIYKLSEQKIHIVIIAQHFVKIKTK